jgi:hypothetical protein
MSRDARPSRRRQFDDDYGNDGSIFVVRPASVPAPAPPARVRLVCPQTTATHRYEVLAIDEPASPRMFCPDHRLELVRSES